MPELPEVETIRRALEPLLVGRRVVRAELRRRDVLVMPGDPFGGFARQRPHRPPSPSPSARAAKAKPRPAPTSPRDLLEGSTIGALRRRGKQLAILADDTNGPVLVVQLGMSGQLLVPKNLPDDKPRRGQPTPFPTHVHAVWRLDDGSRLLFRDPRRFGGLRALPNQVALDELWQPLGPDALSVTADGLHEALSGTRRLVKAALLDQSLVAGVGNIYADEALFAAGISPRRRADTLTPAETARLAAALREVLDHAVAHGGSTLRDYVTPGGDAGSYQARHLVYGHAGEPCPRCGGTLTSATLAGRTTVWCPTCQPTRPPRRG